MKKRSRSIGDSKAKPSSKDTWSNHDGIMSYAEIRLRDVTSGKIDLNRSKTPRSLGKFLTSRRVSAPVGESVPFERTCSPVLCDHSATLRLGRSDLRLSL